MSREWYIRTDKRNIQETFGDLKTVPLTRREKWRKNRKKYLLCGIAVLLLSGMLALALPGILTHPKQDYIVTLVTMQPTGSAADNALQAALAAVGTDRDGDGRVTVQVRRITVGGDTAAANIGREQFISSFLANTYTLFAMEPDCYTQYLAPYIAENTSLFSPLNAPQGTVLSADGGLWQNGTLLFGVRALPDSCDSKDAENAAAHRALLEAYMAAAAE